MRIKKLPLKELSSSDHSSKKSKYLDNKLFLLLNSISKLNMLPVVGHVKL